MNTDKKADKERWGLSSALQPASAYSRFSIQNWMGPRFSAMLGHPMRTRPVFFALALAPLLAQAPKIRSTAKDRTGLSVTIYQNGLAAIRDTRRVNLPAGPSRLAFADLVPTLRPKSATLLDPGGGIQVRERNYEFNLLSPTSLVDASLGQPVRIKGEDGKPDIEGTLASLPLRKRRLGLLLEPPPIANVEEMDPPPPPPPPPPPVGYEAPLTEDEEDDQPLWRHDLVILQRRDAKVLVATREGFIPAKPSSIGFQTVPNDLHVSPTLFQSLEAEKDHEGSLTLLYTAENLEWFCHYEGILDTSAQHLDLQAFARVKNRSGAALSNATLQLIAGEPNVVVDPPPQVEELFDGIPGGVVGGVVGGMLGGPPTFREEKLSEYPLFTLDRPVSLKDQQEKQLVLFRATHIPVKTSLLVTPPYEDFAGYSNFLNNPVFDATPNIDHWDASIAQSAWMLRHHPKVLRLANLRNTKENRLGRALPLGTLTLRYQDPGGAMVLLPGFGGYTSQLPQTPPGGNIELALGPAAGFRVDRKINYKKVLSSKIIITGDGKGQHQPRWEYGIQIQISNDHPGAEVITVREPIKGGRELINSSHKGHRSGTNAWDFIVKVPAHGQVTMSYSVLTSPEDTPDTSDEEAP